MVELSKGGRCYRDNGSGDILMLLRAGDRLLTSLHVWRHENGRVDKVAEDFEDLL